MTNILIAICLLGAVSFIPKLFGRRRSITPRIEKPRPEPRITIDARRKPEETARVDSAATAWIDPAASAGLPDYLLSGRHPDGSVDRTAAMMDMMSGPGICTPRDRSAPT